MTEVGPWNKVVKGKQGYSVKVSSAKPRAGTQVLWTFFCLRLSSHA